MPDFCKRLPPALESIVSSIPFDVFALLGLDVNVTFDVGLPEMSMLATGDLLRLFSRDVGLGVLVMLATGELLILTSRGVGLDEMLLSWLGVGSDVTMVAFGDTDGALVSIGLSIGSSLSKRK